MTSAARRWAEELVAWAVPPEILAVPPPQQFVFPAEMFAPPPPGTAEPSRSTQIAAQAVVDGGSVLDVGSGGGACVTSSSRPSA